MTRTVHPPSGIHEGPEQLRPPIIRASGSTDSERILAALAERSFLNLWSYPNPYRDQKAFASGDGKELCDLLVVCGEHVIIFSEKTIEWPSGETPIAWSRWARRAIQSSARQMHGAARWILEQPTRVFLDKDCTQPFPIKLPDAAEIKLHRVLVARGAEQACKEHFGVGSGSLVICPAIKGATHWTPDAPDFAPFAIGDLDPHGSFIHVFDDYSLSVLMKEQDTFCDFTDYLTKREILVRSGKLQEAHGEENLLACYATRINDDGDHDFVFDGSTGPVSVQRGRYEKYISDPRYLAKKEADRISYLWDALIEAFTKPMLDGTSLSPEGFEFDLARSETGVRHMALESRFFRRGLGEAFSEALRKGERTDRFFRVVLSRREGEANGTAFFIQTFKYLDWMDQKGGYEQYRKKRSEFAMVYARGLLERYPNLKRVIGISREPPNQGRGVSEDLIYAEQHAWSEQERENIKKDCETYNVLQNMGSGTVWDGTEFPEVVQMVFDPPRVPSTVPRMNRKQRRAAKSKARKRAHRSAK